jgi:hypothetical protein
MLMGESTRAAGAEACSLIVGTPSLGREGRLGMSPTVDVGLLMVSSIDRTDPSFTSDADSIEGNRNSESISGPGFDDAAFTPGVLGAVDAPDGRFCGAFRSRG